MGKDDRWPAEVRPYRWTEFEEHPAAKPGPAPVAQEVVPVGPSPASLLSAAKVEAAALLDEARLRAKELREKARVEGHEAGLSSGKALTAQAVERWLAAAEGLAEHKPRLLEEARTQLVDLALALVGKILGPLAQDDREAITRVAGRALAALSDRELVTIRVSPEDLPHLLDAKPRLLQHVDGIKKLTVTEDHSVPRGGCIVETPTAEIDARLDVQLEELARNLKKL